MNLSISMSHLFLKKDVASVVSLQVNMPDNQEIALRPMPQQEGVRIEDDWTGTIDRVERRKLQNRLNQRSYRKPHTCNSI
jgi:hypothetical protein